MFLKKLLYIDRGVSNFTSLFSTYTEPYCESGMTLAFWVRLLRGEENRDGYVRIIGQASDGHGGISIWIKPYLSKACFYIELDVHKWRCCFYNIPNDLYRQWLFLSMSLDPAPLSKMVCFMNKKRVTRGILSGTSSGPTSQFFAGDRGKFLLDDILYLPKFSNDEMISSFFNKSKF